MPILESFPHPSARPQSFVSCGAGTGSRFQKQAVPLLTSLPLPCAGWYLLNCLAGSPGGLPSCCCSVAKLGPTLCNPWTAAPQASLSLTISWSLPKFMSTELVMPSNHFILCHPLLLLPSIFPSIREKFPVSQLFASRGQSIGASASASVLAMNIQGWFPLGLTSLIFLQSKGLSRVFSNTTIFRCSAFFMVQLSHPYMTIGKSVSLTIQIFVGKVISLLFNTLSRVVMTFLHRSNCLLISWLQSPSAVIVEPEKKKSVTASPFSPCICHEVIGLMP